MRMNIPKTTFAVVLVFVLAGCTTVEEIKRPGGVKQYNIACGAALGWHICYDKANELCPNGYTDVDKRAGFNRKELIIECPE